MYAGHLPDGSSVQKHSAGGLYPYVIYLLAGTCNQANALATHFKTEYDQGLRH